MTKDDNIIFRVFEYSYHHANRHTRTDEHSYELFFPEPKIIYLYSEADVPDEYTLILNFGSQGTFPYKVSTFKFIETSIEELNIRKMIILIPFYLLKLRKIMEKERSAQNLEALKNLIQNDIIESIKKNLEVKNITLNDAFLLTRLTKMLYDHIYSHYDELKEITEMTDESLLFDVDILAKEYEEKISDIEKEADRVRDKLANTENQLHAVTTKLQDKNKKLANTKQQLSDTEQQLSNTAHKLSDTEQQLSHTAHKLSDTEQQLSDTTKLLHDNTQKLADAQNEIATLKQQLAEWQQTHS